MRNKNTMKKEEQGTKKVGFAIFSNILKNKKAIEKSIKEGKPINEINGVKIAKPL